MTDSKYIKKSFVRWIVVGTFLFSSAVNMVGLKIVQDHASARASAVAVRAANANAKIQRQSSEQQAENIRYQTYNSNKTACAVRAIVDPALKDAQKALRRFQAAAKDKSLPASSRQRSAKGMKDTRASIKTLRKVRAAYGTIPPDFDCSKLPKNLPVPNVK